MNQVDAGEAMRQNGSMYLSKGFPFRFHVALGDCTSQERTRTAIVHIGIVHKWV